MRHRHRRPATPLCPAGEAWVSFNVRLALRLRRVHRVRDVTRRCIRWSLTIKRLRSLHDAIQDQGRAHQEVGRRIRAALAAQAGERVWLPDGCPEVIGSYTELHY